MARSLLCAGAVLLLLVAAGCDNSVLEEPPGQDMPAQDAAAPLVVWHTLDERAAPAFDALIASYRETHSDLDLRVEAKPFSAARAAYLEAARQNAAPDLFLAEVSWVLELADRNLIAGLDEMADAADLEDFLPEALTHCRVRGSLCAMPQTVDCLALLYNRRLLRQAGVEVPETMHDLALAAAQLSDPETGRYGFYLHANAYWVLPFIFAFGGELIDPLTEEPAIRSPMAEEALRFVLQLRDDHGAMPKVADFTNDYESMVAGIQSGTYAMVLNGPWAVSEILQGPEFADPDNLGISPVPRGPGGYGAPSGGHSWVITRTSAKRAEAYALAAYLTGLESQLRLAQSTPLLPSRKSVYEQDALSGNRILQQFRGALEHTSARSAVPNAATLYPRLTEALQALLEGQESPQSCVERVDRAWRSALAQ